MTPILIYDTETTGLPNFNKPSEDPCQPRITQIAAELFDEESGDVLHAINFIIKPNGWTIPPNLESLTGITTERAMQIGIPIEKALPLFMDLWEKSEFRIAHNENFDMRMVRIEIKKSDIYTNDYADQWKNGAAYCTLNNCTNILNLPPTERMLAAGRTGPKSPNLTEAYRYFTGTELENAHNAAVDIMACKEVYFGIKKHNSGEK